MYLFRQKKTNFAKLVERSCCGKNPRLSGKPNRSRNPPLCQTISQRRHCFLKKKLAKLFLMLFFAIALVMYFALSVSCCHLYILYSLGNRTGGDFEKVEITCSREILRFVAQKMRLSGYNATELFFYLI